MRAPSHASLELMWETMLLLLDNKDATEDFLEASAIPEIFICSLFAESLSGNWVVHNYRLTRRGRSPAQS